MAVHFRTAAAAAIVPPIDLKSTTHAQAALPLVEMYRYPHFTTFESFKHLCMPHLQNIKTKVCEAKEQFNQDLECFLALPIETPAVEVLHAYDGMIARLKLPMDVFETLGRVAPQKYYQEACEQAFKELHIHYLDLIFFTEGLYKKLEEVLKQEKRTPTLTPVQQYYLQQVLGAMRKQGLHLDPVKRMQAYAIQKTLAVLGQEFTNNLKKEASFIYVSEEALAGISEELKNKLEKVGSLYKVSCSPHIYFSFMRECEVAETRKKLYETFRNQFHPQHTDLLKEIIKQRHLLADLLGFPSYAHLELSQEMLETPEKVTAFLDELEVIVKEKQSQEFEALKEEFSELLATEHSFYAWDIFYLQEHYRLKHYATSDAALRKHFPQERTIQNVLEIFRTEFRLKIEKTPESLWHEDVQFYKVSSSVDSTEYGYVALDLMTRPHKHSHERVSPFVSGLSLSDGSSTPSCEVVITNFSKGSASAPASMTLKEVSTLFHEMGHALHALLGRTEFYQTAGLNASIGALSLNHHVDFVEYPSQFLELWLKDNLKRVSPSLPEDLLGNLRKEANAFSGFTFGSELFFSRFCLACFSEGAVKDLWELEQTIYKTSHPYYLNHPNSHRWASAGHLIEYGARYYGYPWARALAMDTLRMLNAKHGSFDAYLDILKQGGSKSPMEVLSEALREHPKPNTLLSNILNRTLT
jgi:thimet oligopeptidase